MVGFIEEENGVVVSTIMVVINLKMLVVVVAIPIVLIKEVQVQNIEP